MDAQRCLEIGNLLSVIGWVLLVAFPSTKLTLYLVRRHVLPVSLSLMYLVFVATNLGVLKPDSFETITNLRTLFQNDGFLLAGWLHYLAFDLVIGTAIADDAKLRGISRWVMLPILFLTFYLGPIGYLLYRCLAPFRDAPRQTPPTSSASAQP